MRDEMRAISIYGGLAILALVLCAPAACLAGPAGGGSVTLVTDGKPMATIVMSDDADDVVKKAVADLQMYIEKMSGAKLPIVPSSAGVVGDVILVGRTPEVEKLIPELDDYDLGHDGVVIRTLDGKLIITGQSDGWYHKDFGPVECGTPNAVYTFLEHLGCRWYAPGDDGQVVPRKTTIVVAGMDTVSKPDFNARWIFHWCATNRMGIGGTADVEFKIWLNRTRTSSNMYDQGHNMYGLLPKKLCTESHPEFGALVDGTRRTDGAAQFCMSNPGVADMVTTNFMKLVADDPRRRAYGLGQYDSWLWCQCQPCRAMYGDKTFTYNDPKEARIVGQGVKDTPVANVANGYLTFVNTIAGEMAKRHPDALVTYLSIYNIPGFPEVRPADNVLPIVAHIAPRDRVWRREVSKWADMSKHLYFYTYMGYRTGLPKFNVVDDIRWCHQNKGIGIAMEPDEFSPANTLALYLTTRAMWDAKTDAKRVLADFYRDFYGPAARPMQRFWETFDAATRKAALDWDSHPVFPDTLTRGKVEACRKYLTAAASLADRPVVRRRIESVSRYWRATELHTTARLAMDAWNADKTQSNRQAARKALQEIEAYIPSVGGEFYLKLRLPAIRTQLAEVDFDETTVLMELPVTWQFKKDPSAVGIEEKWFAGDADASWVKIDTTKDWTSQGHNYHGVAWYRTPFTLPANLKADEKLALSFGAVDGYADVYLNGVKIGEQKKPPGEMWDIRFDIALPADVARGEPHQLVVRVKKDLYGAGIWKRVSVVKRTK